MRGVAAIVTVISTLASLALGTGQLCAQEVTVEGVTRMWSERQSNTKTAEFRWRETVGRPVNPLDPRGVPQPPPGDAIEVDGKLVPLNQVLAVTDHECILRLGVDLNIRSESIPVQNLDESADWLTRPGLSVSAFNGERNAYYTAALGPDDHHRGIEFDAEVYDEIVNYHLRAVVLSYRPLLMARSYFSHEEGRIVRHDTTLRIVNRDAIFNGHLCLILESAPNGPVTNRYWVDTARDGLILKHVQIASGRTTSELEINYENHEQHGWVPSNWHANFLNGRSQVDAEVVDFTINGPMTANTFEIDYPAGTVVFDQDRGEQRRILTDGTEELITP